MTRARGRATYGYGGYRDGTTHRIVTGGMGGLGVSISTKLHDAGCRVVVTHTPGNRNVAQWPSDHEAKHYRFAAAFITGASIAINGGQHMQ